MGQTSAIIIKQTFKRAIACSVRRPFKCTFLNTSCYHLIQTAFTNKYVQQLLFAVTKTKYRNSDVLLTCFMPGASCSSLLESAQQNSCLSLVPEPQNLVSPSFNGNTSTYFLLFLQGACLYLLRAVFLDSAAFSNAHFASCTMPAVIPSHSRSKHTQRSRLAIQVCQEIQLLCAQREPHLHSSWETR